MVKGLALAAGGAKGVYQVGAWKALSEYNHHFDYIAGTSIGAINGALMAQGDFDHALHLWQNLRMDQCLSFADGSDLSSIKDFGIKDADKLISEYLRNRGLNTSPFRELLSQYIDEHRVRASNVKFGLLTATTPNIKPVELWINEIPKGCLVDYLMASSRLPGLKHVKINNKQYIDGGLVENVPLNMLIKTGSRDLYAIALRSNSNLKLSQFPCRRFSYIHNRIDLGNIFDITPSKLKLNISLGYLDALKVLGVLNGEFYYFYDADYICILKEYGFNITMGLEQAALAYNIDRKLVWSPNAFIAEIQANRAKFNEQYQQSREELQIEHKLRLAAVGKLKSLKLSPSMRLSFLLEVLSEMQKNNRSIQLPMKLFKNLDHAGKALCRLDQEKQDWSRYSPQPLSKNIVPDQLVNGFRD